MTQFIIEKNGLYYRPEAAGYTGLKREAGRYSFDEAVQRVGPNGPEGSQDGLSMWKEEDAPTFSGNCPNDLQVYERRFIEGWNAALNAAAVTARHRHTKWNDSSGVECDASACNDIANEIMKMEAVVQT